MGCCTQKKFFYCIIMAQKEIEEMKVYEEFVLEIIRFDEEAVRTSSGNEYSIGDDIAGDIF